jgi:folate-binding protein YgfZ
VAAAAIPMNPSAARDGASVKSQVMSEFAADLSNNAVLSVSGDDAAAFLQGQLTNDVEALGVNRAQWNGWCSPKGRLLATFLLVRRPDGYLLMLPAEIAGPIAKRLGMFVLRSKVKIADVSDRYARRGIIGRRAGPAPMEVVEDEGAILVGLEPGRIVALMPPERALTPNAGADAWELAAIRAGVPTITAATQEAFVPQMANFELVGGVSFKKGCYPGQEIVARMQYRGGLKRRMAIAHVDGTERPQPGQSVYSAAFGEQAAGTIVNAAPAPEGGFDALVVAQIESLDRRDLRWKSPDGPGLEVRSHPPLAA